MVDKNNTLYFMNDSVKNWYEIQFNHWSVIGIDSLYTPSINRTTKYVFRNLHYNKKDLILYSQDDFSVISRNKSYNYNSYFQYDIFDTTFYNYQINKPKPSIYLYRKTYVNKNKNLYYIEDIFPLNNNKLISFIYIAVGSEKKDIGWWWLDPTNNDNIGFVSGYYKHCLDVSRRNIIKIVSNHNKI
jgi:hypothetical protein